MDPGTSFVLRQPGTYLTFLATALPQLIVMGLISPQSHWSQWIAYTSWLLAAYGVKSLALATQPRTPWTDEQREAFRNTHPSVQKEQGK